MVKQSVQKILSNLYNERGAAPILILLTLIGLLAFITLTSTLPFNDEILNFLYPKGEPKAASSFSESFTGQPTTPARFWNDSSLAANWNVVTNVSDSWGGSNENGDFNNPLGHHGPDCGPPLDASNRLITHPVPNIHDAVFQCKDHIMTSLLSGYAVAYLTPNHMVDLSQGEAVIRFDMTTYSTSGRDWVDLWIMPMSENFVVPLEHWLPTYSGPPKTAVHIRTDGNNEDAPGNSSAWHWEGTIYRNFTEEGMSGNGNFYGGINTALKNSGAQVNGVPVTVSPQRRDTFELRVSRTRAKMCLVSVNTVPPVPTNQCWFDASFSDLGWSSGVVMFGHHAYNNQKDCSPSGLGGSYLDISCLANTWHWDQVSISPSIPFTIIKPTPSSPKFITLTNNTVNLTSPAPANSFVRFAAVAGSVEASFNDGPWTTIPRRQQTKDAPEHFSNYWGAVPTGTTKIAFRGTRAASWLDRFNIQHVAVYSTATPLATLIPTPTPNTQPTVAPTPAPIGSTQTVTFDDKSGQNQVLLGQYPSNVIDWGSTNGWWHSAPFGQLPTKNFTFNGNQGTNSASLTLLSPKKVLSLQAFNGGASSSTVTLSCPGNSNKIIILSPNQLESIVTSWSNPCSSMTLSSSNGWDTNFDNLVLETTSGGGVATPTPIPTIIPTPVPTIIPTPTPVPTVIPTPTPISALRTITFDDKAGQNTGLTGQYPLGVIDWGTSGWYLSSPWKLFKTKNISFSGGTLKSAGFKLLTPRKIRSVEAFNGGTTSSTVTLACAGNPNKQVIIAAGQLMTITTGWSISCSSVTVSSTNGWDTNFDNLVIE